MKYSILLSLLLISIPFYMTARMVEGTIVLNGETEEVTFFNKGAILKELDSLPRDTYLELDVRKTRYLDNDIVEILDDFAYKAKERNIDIKLISERGTIENPESFIEFFKLRPKSA